MDELGHEPVSAPATVVEPKGLDERLVWVLSRHKNEETKCTVTRYKCKWCGLEFEGSGAASVRHHIAGTKVKGVVPCPRPDPDEKAKIVNELNRKQAMREENKRKRGQPEGLDSADSSMNFSLPPGFSTLAALASGMGDGTGPSGAGIAGAARFSGIGGADTPGRGNATAGRRGGKGSGAKAQSVQSERRAPFDDSPGQISSAKGKSGGRGRAAGGSANGMRVPLPERAPARRRGPTLTLHKPSSIVDFATQMRRVVQHIDDGHLTAEDSVHLGLDKKALQNLAGRARHHCEHVLQSTEWLTQVLDGEESVTEIQGALQCMQESKGHDAAEDASLAQAWSLLDPANATATSVSDLLSSLTAALKTSAAATNSEGSDGEYQHGDGTAGEGRAEEDRANVEVRRSDRADVGAEELMTVCCRLGSDTDSAVAKAITELKARKSAGGASEGDVNQITDDGQLREHCKSLHARLSDALRVKAELQPSRLIAHQYQNMQHANVYGGMSASVHRPMGYGVGTSGGGTPGYGGWGGGGGARKKDTTQKKAKAARKGAYSAELHIRNLQSANMQITYANGVGSGGMESAVHMSGGHYA